MIYHQDTQLTIHNGDALAVLQTMAAESVQCCVTSPPYYGLRDYGTGQWEGGAAECDHIKPITNYNKGFNERYGNGDGTAAQKQEVKSAGQYSGTCKKCGAIRTDQQIGMEETPELFIARLVDVFREVRRVLKDDGTMWVNIGDSYAGSGRGNNPNGKQGTNKGTSFDPTNSGYVPDGCKAKDLIGTPWMLAFALRADGWYLRSEIIWHKLNPMPESVTDRPTKAHEQVFLLSKSPKYFYDSEAVKEPFADERMGNPGAYKWSYGGDVLKASDATVRGNGGSSHKLQSEGWNADGKTTGRNRRSVWSIASAPYADAHFATFPPALIEPCILAGSRIGDVVLDPFGGSGTTAEVANKFGRKAVLIELNPDYCELEMKRNCQKTLFAGAEV